MSLRSQTFSITQNSSLSSLENYLRSTIGYDAFLIKGMHSSIINTNTVNITVYYESSPEELINSYAPNLGAVFETGLKTSNFDVRFLFNKPINKNNLYSGQFSIDDQGISTGNLSINTGYNNYFAKISASNPSFQTSEFHYYTIGTGLQFVDGSYLDKIYPGGYVFHTPSVATVGNQYNYLPYRRGVISVKHISYPKINNQQQIINQFLISQELDYTSLLAYSSIERESSIDSYFIYISNPEPQISKGFPYNNSLFPDTTIPSKLLLTFNVALDQNSFTNSFAIESGWLNPANISSSDITLLTDKKTINIDLSSYVTSAGIYSVIAKPGLKSLLGIEKEKPEQWVLQVAEFEGRSSVDFTSSTVGYVIITGDYNISSLSTIYYCSGNLTLTIPDAVGIGGSLLWIKNIAGITKITGTNFIDNNSSIELAANDSVTLSSNNLNWWII